LITVNQSATAVAPFIQASFGATGGDEPYLYTVLPDGAGGSIDPTTGIYTAPGFVQEDPRKVFDTIQVEDYSGEKATARILVGTPLMLLCEIVRRELALGDRYVYLWDQKIEQPKDEKLYIAVSLLTAKVVGNVSGVASVSGGGLNSEQFVSMRASVTLDVISRSTAALHRKEEVLMALASVYSRQQQDANSFSVATIPMAFVNLSQVDGAAIPYRYQITVGMFYAQPRVKPAPYYDDFRAPETTELP
jgi:hypothetical protein